MEKKEPPLSSGGSFANSSKGYYQVQVDGTNVQVREFYYPAQMGLGQQQPARESGYLQEFDLSSNDVGDEPSLGKYRPPEGNPFDILGGIVFNNRPSEVELKAKITASIK